MYLDVRDTGTSKMGRGHWNCCVWGTQFQRLPGPGPPQLLCPPVPPQFVPFRDYMSGGPGAGLSMAGLAREVLAEIPDQLLSYMKARGIKPPPIPPTSPETPPP